LKRLITTLFLLLVILPSGAGADDGAVTLTIEDSVRIALENNYSVLAGKDRVDGALAGVGKAWSSFIPKVDVSETYMRTDNPVMAFSAKLNQRAFTNTDFINVNDPSPVNNFNTRVQATVPVFNGGKEWVGLRRSRLSLAASEDALERARQETVYQVIQGYYGVVLAGEYVKTAEESVKATEGHLKLAQSFFDQGMLIGSEVLLAKVRLAEVKETLIRAKNREATARAAFNTILARPQDTAFQTAGQLEYKEWKVDLGELQQEALRVRPDLAGMGQNVRNLEEGIRLAKTDYLPNLNFIGRYELDDKDPFKGRADSYTILGMITWNIFDGFLTTSNVRAARADKNAASHMLDQMRDGVLFEVRKAYYDMQEAAERVAVTGSAVAEGEESLRIIESRFKGGMAKTQDALDAESALSRARTNALQALYDYNVAVAALKLAAGRMEY
jgi:outer membrane protein